MSELSIEQKVRLLEKVLGYTKKLKPSFTETPQSYYDIYNGVVYIGTPFEIPIVGGKFDGWYDCTYEAFKPEGNLIQAMELLNGLSSLSDLIWYIAFRGNNEYAVRCDTVEYTEYDYNLCKLIVNACLWWLENKVEE